MVGDAEEKNGEGEEDILPVIHDDISLMQFVIPGLTRNPGFPVKTGIHFLMVSCLRRNVVWIPAGVYPVVERGGNDAV